MYLKLRPATLTADEWQIIESVYANSTFLPILQKLRFDDNKPVRACDLLPEDIVNQGNEQISAVMRDAKLPFRLSRIGSWRGQSRMDRPLAIVRLTPELQEKLRRKKHGPRH